MLNTFLILKKGIKTYNFPSSEKYSPFFYLYDEYMMVPYLIDYIQEKVKKGENGSASFNSFAIIILPTGKLRIEYLYDDFENADFYRFEITFNLLEKIINKLSHFDHKKYAKIIMTMDEEKDFFSIEGFEKLTPEEENDPIWQTGFRFHREH